MKVFEEMRAEFVQIGMTEKDAEDAAQFLQRQSILPKVRRKSQQRTNIL
jgi:hypothetical protein